MSADPTIHPELARMSRAVRFALASIVLGLSYPNIHCALTFRDFQSGFGAPTAGLGALMFQYQPLLVGLSILFPLAAVAVIFTPGIIRSIHASGILVIAVFIQLFLQWVTVMEPISKMAQ